MIKVFLSFFKRILQKTSSYKVFLILSVLFNSIYEDQLKHVESIKRASVLKGLKKTCNCFQERNCQAFFKYSAWSPERMNICFGPPTLQFGIT
jgi:hypothetical protein